MMAASPSAEFQAFQRKYGIAFEQMQAALLNLDGSRVFNLMEECRQRYGRLTRERASQTYHHWRDGHYALSDEPTACLFELLPRHLSSVEKLALLKSLRQQVLSQLFSETVSVTIVDERDLAAVVQRIMGLLRRVPNMELPPDFLTVQDWLTRADMQALNQMVKETERFIAVHRLADLMVQIATLSRLRLLASPQTAISVSARLEIPTATVLLRFHPSFWSKAAQADEDHDLLIHLQELALQPEFLNRGSAYVEQIMRALPAAEQEKVGFLAASEGVQAESLLRELHAKTLVARLDIEGTIAAAQRLQARSHPSRIQSKHVTASGTTVIEIRSRCSCPAASLAATLQNRLQRLLTDPKHEN